MQPAGFIFKFSFWENHLRSISPTLYEQLLHEKIPKVQKRPDDLTVFFVLLGSAHIKAAHKDVGEIDHWSQKNTASEF